MMSDWWAVDDCAWTLSVHLFRCNPSPCLHCSGAWGLSYSSCKNGIPSFLVLGWLNPWHTAEASQNRRPWVRCPSPQHPLREAVSLMRATPWHLHDHTALWGFTFVPPGLMREKPLPSGTGSGFLHHLLLPVLITAHIFIVSPFTKFSPNSPFFSCHLL